MNSLKKCLPRLMATSILITGAVTAVCGQGSTTHHQHSSSSSKGMSDTSFIRKNIRDNIHEIQLSQIAVDRESGQKVKSLAQQLVTDHTQMLNDLLTLARNKNMENINSSEMNISSDTIGMMNTSSGNTGIGAGANNNSSGNGNNSAGMNAGNGGAPGSSSSDVGNTSAQNAGSIGSGGTLGTPNTSGNNNSNKSNGSSANSTNATSGTASSSASGSGNTTGSSSSEVGATTSQNSGSIGNGGTLGNTGNASNGGTSSNADNSANENNSSRTGTDRSSHSMKGNMSGNGDGHFEHEKRELQEASNEKFDALWAEEMLDMHNAKLRELTNASKTVNDADLKTAITSAISKVRMHRDMLAGISKGSEKEGKGKHHKNQ